MKIFNWKTVYFFLLTGLIFGVARHWSYDDPYITYRYAENIARGLGPVYNEGVRTLSTTTPLLALLLSVLKFFWSDLAQIAALLGAISLALGGLILYEMAVAYRTPAAGWFALIAYPTFPLLLGTISSETPIYITLILTSIWAYHSRKYSLTGFFSALVVLARPDGVLVPFIIGIHFLLFIRHPIPWKAIVIFLAITLSWFGFAWVYYGSPLPVTLFAKQQQGEMAASQRFFAGVIPTFEWFINQWPYWIAAAIGMIGLVTIIVRRLAWGLLLLWTAAYFTAYSILGVSRYYWYYAPLVPGLILCTGTGLHMLWEIARTNKKILLRLVSVTALIICFGSISYMQARNLRRFQFIIDDRISVYREVGEWLRSNTPENTIVSALEIGAVGYYSQRTMIDFAGLLQPDIARQLTSETTYEDAAVYAVEQYHPEYTVLLKDDFLTFREQYISKNCTLVSTFESKKVSVDLFSCR